MKEKTAALRRQTILAIAMVGLSGSVAMALLPLFTGSRGTIPPPAVFIAAGLIGLVVTVISLMLVGRFEPRLKRRFLILVLAYNVIIVAVKFVLAPWGLYTVNQQGAFTDGVFSFNSASYYLVSAAIIFLLYCFVLTIVYLVYRHRVFPALKSAKAGRGKRVARGVGIAVAAIVGSVVFSGGGFIILPVLLGGTGLSYLALVAGSPQFWAIVAALVAATALAAGAFNEAAIDAGGLKDASLLASLLWTGLILIAVYHIMWVVLMITLVSTWPFNTYTSK